MGKGSAPLFGNFLEPISLTPWWVIPLVWLPPNFYLFYVGFVNQSPITALSLWVMGLFIWTLVEYCLHRFLFHLDYFCLTILMHLLSTFFCTGSTTICPWMATGWSYHQLCFGFGLPILQVDFLNISFLYGLFRICWWYLRLYHV